MRSSRPSRTNSGKRSMSAPHPKPSSGPCVRQRRCALEHEVLHPKLTDEEADALMGEQPMPNHYDTLFDGTRSVHLRRPDGSPLAIYVPDAFTSEQVALAY